MTETQTPNPDCTACAGTGFVPPFMDACDCAPVAVVGGDDFPTTTEPMYVKFTAETPVVGTIVNTGGIVRVWTGDEWKPVLTEALTSAEYTAKYVAEDPAGLAAAGLVDDMASAPKTSSDTFAALVDACEAIPPKPDYAAGYGEAGIYSDPSISYGSPKKPAAKLATEAQRLLLGRLTAERDPSNAVVANAVYSLTTSDLSARDASKLIDALMLIPATKPAVRPNSYDGTCGRCAGPVAAHAGRIEKLPTGRWTTYHLDGHCLTAEQKAELEADRVTEPGIYKAGDGTRFYRVRKSRTSTRLYAELIVANSDGTASFAYNAKAMGFLRRSDRLTWQEARDWGVAFGACIACGRTLSDPRSLVQGWGNTCAKTYGWPTVTVSQAEAIIAGVITWDEAIGV